MSEFLVIEDDEGVRAVLCGMLERLGHQVVLACDGAEGVSMFQKRQSPNVITDMLMPEKEGLQTIHEIREISPEVRILAISGGGRSINAGSCLKLASSMGANCVLEKPFDFKQIGDAVNQLIGE
ncbi:MAG: CheY-like chemotaxis protein [Planctomycetota bacterium]|jgi:CheY-like chemotaxis protein